MGIPDLVKAVLESEHKKRIDEEFLKGVDVESTKIAGGKLEKLKTEAWPKFVKEQVEPKASELATILHDQLVNFLSGEYWFRCDKCQTEGSFRLLPEHIAQMLMDGWFKIQCGNEACRDPFGRHEIKLSVVDFITNRLLP